MAQALVPSDPQTELRDRVTQFFQAQIDGRYREAYTFVAEGWKDRFFKAAKPVIVAVRIDHIEIDTIGSSAQVTVTIVRPDPQGAPPRYEVLQTNWLREGRLWMVQYPPSPPRL